MAEADREGLINKIHGLSDLELAALLCIVAGQHCIVEAGDEILDQVAQELSLAVSNNFHLSVSIVECSSDRTLDDFRHDIMVPNNEGKSHSCKDDSSVNKTPLPRAHNTGKATQSSTRSVCAMDEMEQQSIAQVIIVKNLNLAALHIQIQALELIRNKRIFTRTAFHTVPKRFLLIILQSESRSHPKLNFHLNDHIFISHYHSSDAGLPNVEQEYDSAADDGASMSSVVRKPVERPPKHEQKEPIFSEKDLETLISRRNATTISAEVKRYMQNLTTFLRMHRAVAGGISAYATRHFELLVKCLAPLHSLSYATPSLAALAARKIYPHRIVITKPENERSMQWGSDLRAVADMLQGITPEDIIDEVINMVEAPL